MTRAEARFLRSLDPPWKIQKYLDGIDYDFKGSHCRSPRRVLRERTVQCMDGAMFAAAALRFSGRPPLIFDLEGDRDSDHVLAVFRERGCWGAIGRSNFSGLRYREPIHRTLRDLALSYFESYFNLRREKTLRRYARRPVNLSRFDDRDWMTSEKDLWFIPFFLEDIPHVRLLTPAQERGLASVDKRMFAAGLVGREE
jgi:hypothetical protein